MGIWYEIITMDLKSKYPSITFFFFCVTCQFIILFYILSGNELSGGGVSAKVDANQYGKDMIVLKNLVNELYQNSGIQPKILGPGGFFDEKWFVEHLQVSGPNVVDIVSHHIYNLGPG